MSKKKPEGNPGHPGPWRPDEVRGVVPPGRRLDNKPRPLPWNASGVVGVTPPGTQQPGQSAQRTPAQKKPKKKPGAPEKPEADKGLKRVLDQIADFVQDNPVQEAAVVDLAREVQQTHAPFELIVAFTCLSTAVGADDVKRHKFQLSLERGAKAYFNMARRLDKSVRPPRGLIPQTLDPIFYDLPTTAYELPTAFVTDAFCRMLDLLHDTPAYDRKLIGLARKLRKDHIAGRRLGDQAMERMFPWEEPAWAPD